MSLNRVSAWRGGIVCMLAALFYVYDYFIQVAPSVMVPDLMRDFHVGAGALGLLSACFFYAYAVMQMPAGWLLDRLGARYLLTLAVLTSAAGVGLFGVSHTVWLACVSRFMIGFGSAFAFISTLYLIANWFSHKYFATLAGFVQLGGCLGSMMGLTPIAILVDRVGWRVAMTDTSLATLVLGLLFFFVIRDRPPRPQHPESFSQSRTPFWRALTGLLRRPQVIIICLCGFLSWVPVGGVGALWGVPYLMKVYHIGNTEASRYILCFWLGLGAGSPLIGWLSQYWQRRKRPIIICFMSACAASLMLLSAPHLSVGWMVVALGLLGFSASVQSLTFSVLKDVVPPSQFSFASGMNNMAAILGGGIAQPLIGLCLRWFWLGHYYHGVPYYSVTTYQYSLFLLIPIAMLGLGVAAMGLRETCCQPALVLTSDEPSLEAVELEA